MFDLSDKPNGIASQRVQHKQTGDIGIVVGYGNRQVNGNYLTTIKVQITRSTTTKEILESLVNEWLLCQEQEN